MVAERVAERVSQSVRTRHSLELGGTTTTE